MNPRKLLAVAVLAALPTVATASRAMQPVPSANQAAWMYALDMDSRAEGAVVGTFAAVGCAFFLLPGAIACGLVGVA